jgi:hypothetical protein
MALTVDTVLRFTLLSIFFGFLLLHGSVLEIHYPQRVVELYDFPWWRFLLVFLVLAATAWCPYLGIAVATAVFFYLNDMFLLTKPFARHQ